MQGSTKKRFLMMYVCSAAIQSARQAASKNEIRVYSVSPLEAGICSRRAKLAGPRSFALQMRWEVLLMVPLKELLRSFLFHIPIVGTRYRELYEISVRYHRLNPGHYSSPIPSDEDVARRGSEPEASVDTEFPGISLQTSSQLELLSRLEKLAATHPFTDKAEPGQRYYFSNDWFQYTDALMLHGMLRHFLPKRLVEVGSGFSSFVILDTLQMDPRLQCRVTLIEPNSERLRSRLSLSDEHHVELINSEVQRTSPNWFEHLEANDVLLVDSSHVSKCGSDVNFIVHEVLPRLKPGVLVHFHDIFFPFEYPEAHLRNSNHWNEAYILRAYLMHNDRYEIVMWNHYVKLFFGHQFPIILDASRKDLACSLWLRRV